MITQKATYPLPCGNTSHIEGFSKVGASCKNCRNVLKSKYSGGHTYTCVLEENMKEGSIVGGGTRQLIHPVRVHGTDYCPRHCWEVIEDVEE